jgi:predicted O-methyltransferase YrrM
LSHILSRLHNGLSLWRRAGTKETLIQSGREVGRTLAARPRRFSRPSLLELYQRADGSFVNARPLLEDAGFPISDEEWHSLQAECTAALERVNEKYRSHPRYGAVWAVEAETARLLYALTRLSRPKVIVESGVADGFSTSIFLNALVTNGSGVLHSLDVSPDVGSLVGPELKDRWTLHVLDQRRLSMSLTDLFEKLPPIDLFLHDSDHSYAWQVKELELAARRLSPNGIIACDDADASFAFVDACRRSGRRSYMLVEPRKVFGLAVPR